MTAAHAPPRGSRSVRGEDDEERIAFRADLDAAVAGERLTQQRLMLRQRRQILAAKSIEQACRPLDIREQQCDRALRKLRHTSSIATIRPSSRPRHLESTHLSVLEPRV